MRILYVRGRPFPENALYNGGMPRTMAKVTTFLCTAALLAVAARADAEPSRRRERERPAPPPKTELLDKRDSVVVAPGTPFNNRPYWLALGQCGGIYFKLVELSTDAAIQARVVKRDKAADTKFSQQADEARKIATAFFVAAERTLIAERNIERDAAITIYDAKASEAASQLKTIDAALAAAMPCPALYKACQRALAKFCGDVPALTH